MPWQLHPFSKCVRGRTSLIIFLLLAEMGIVGGAYFLFSHHPSRGYLVKKGNEYLLAWKEGPNSFYYRHFPRVSEALDFAHNVLDLSEAVSPAGTDMEYLKLQERFGAYVLLWKVSSLRWLNQLTFHSRDEALYFAGAFKKGSYTPSPFGHSILLFPKSQRVSRQ